MSFVNQTVANNHLQEQFFQDMLETTRDTSTAWQAYYTTLGRLAYHETLPYYDYEATASVTSFRIRPAGAWQPSVQCSVCMLASSSW